MSKVMKTGFLDTKLSYNLFEILAHSIGPQMISKRICKYIPFRIAPRFSKHTLIFILSILDFPQYIHDKGCNGKCTRFAVLSLNKFVLAAPTPYQLELFVDRDRLVFEINTIPQKASGFCLSHPGKKCNNVQIFKLMSLNSFEKSGDMLFI